MSPALLLLGVLAAAEPAADGSASAEVAEGASGGVAVVVSIPDDSAALRSLAAGVVDAAEERWGMLVPPIRPEATEVCQADNLCLVKLAGDRGASHLFVVGVATLAEEEVVVSLQLFDAQSSTEVISFTDVVTPGADPAEVGRSLAEEQLASVEGVPGPDEVEPRWPPPPEPEVEAYAGFSILAIAGWSVVGAGAAIAAGGLMLGVVLTSSGLPLPPQARDATALTAGTLTVGLVGAGLAVVATDLFLQ